MSAWRATPERLARWGSIACCLALAAADWFIPREAAVGVLYAPIVVLSLRSRSVLFVYFIAALATALAWFDYFAHPNDSSFVWAAFDRGTATVAIWFCAVLGLDRMRYQISLEHALRLESLLRREVDHRVRNHLTLLGAMVNLSEDANWASIPQFIGAMRARVQGMTRVHAMLSAGRGGPVRLAEIIRAVTPSELSDAAGTEGSVRATGPEVLVPAAQVSALGAVLHELVLNSAKHGALGAEGGGLEIQWDVAPDGSGRGRRLELFWQEFGGPAIYEYPRPGQGTDLIVTFIREVLGGEAELAFPQGGAFHRFTMLLRETDDAPGAPAADPRKGTIGPATPSPVAA